MSTPEGLFWPLKPLCNEDPYVPKMGMTRKEDKGLSRFSTSKGIPSTLRLLNEGDKYIDPCKRERMQRKEVDKKIIQPTFIVKSSPKKVYPGDPSGTFSGSPVYISDEKPFDWGPRERVVSNTPKNVAVAPAGKSKDIPIKYIPHDYEASQDAERDRLARMRRKEGPAFKVAAAPHIFGQRVPDPPDLTKTQNRPHSAPARRKHSDSSNKTVFVPSGKTMSRSPSVPYVFDPFDEKKKLAATTTSRSLPTKMQMQEKGMRKHLGYGVWKPSSGAKTKYTRSIAIK